MKYHEWLSEDEKKNAESYVTSGGAGMSRDRAVNFAKLYGTTPPRIGYEKTLEEDEHHKLIMMNSAGTIIVRVWTSPNAPGLLNREQRRY